MKKTYAEARQGQFEAKLEIARLCPRGSRVWIKFIRANRDRNGNTRRIVSYLVSHGGSIVCLDSYIADYYQTKQARSDTYGNGIRVYGDGSQEINTISFDIYGTYSAIHTTNLG